MKTIAETYQEIYDKAQSLATQEIKNGEDATQFRKNRRVPTDRSEVDRIAFKRDYHLHFMLEMFASQNQRLTT